MLSHACYQCYHEPTNVCTTLDKGSQPNITVANPSLPMDLSPESRAMSTSSVCLLQGVLNIQNHYSATMHYSTPKTPDKGPIHKTDWTCSKVMKPARGGQSGWLVSVREGLESRGGGREEEEGLFFHFFN